MHSSNQFRLKQTVYSLLSLTTLLSSSAVMPASAATKTTTTTTTTTSKHKVTSSSKSAASKKADASTTQPKVEVHGPKTVTSSAQSQTTTSSSTQSSLQTATSSAALEAWRKTPPTVPAPREFKLPTITQVTLDNGLNVEFVEDHRVPFITMALGIKAGTANEPKDKLGLADMTADMLTEGTATRKSKEIASETDFIGGGLKAFCDYDYAIVSASALSNYREKLLNLFADVALHPNFPEDELKLKKTNLLQTLVMKRSEPSFLVEERFNGVLFGAHPYSVVAPTPETVERISVQDLKEFHDTHYFPNQAVLVVVGDFDTAKFQESINKEFGAGDWKQGQMPVAQMPEVPKQRGTRIYLVDRPGSVQSSIKIGNVGIQKTDPDYYAMTVMNQILGGAAHSRLFLNIREQKGYTYGAYSSMVARKQAGPFAAEAEVRTDVTGPSVQEFLYEIDRIRNTKVSDKELADAKAYLTGSFQLGLETQSGLSQKILESNLYDLPKDYLETYTTKLMAVSVDDVRRTARRLIDNGNLVIAVVGDASKIKSELELFAPVEVYDTSGKLSSESTKSATQPGS